MSTLTSSSLERVGACAASTRLPQHRYTGDEALHGTKNHDDIESGKRDVAALKGMTSIETEPSYVLDVRKRTVTKTGHHREYGKLDDWQIGTTPDVVGIRDGVLTVLDYKSRKRVSAPRKNWQIKTQALAVWHEQIINPAGGAWTHIRAGLVYLDNGEEDLADFGPIDLAAIWSELAQLCERVEQVNQTPIERLTFNAGPWCDYCPGLLSCPTQRAMMQTMMATELTQEGWNERVLAMTDEQIEVVHRNLGVIERMTKMAKEARNLRITQQPAKLSNGKVLRMIESSTTRTDWDLLGQELALHGKTAADFQSKTYYVKPMETKK